MAKCYIRLDKEKNIIKAFTTKFEQPILSDICVEDTPGRHFNWNLMPEGLTDLKGKYNYKYINKSFIKRAESEKYTEAERIAVEKEKLIQSKIMEVQRTEAIIKLQSENLLDANENLIKG